MFRINLKSSFFLLVFVSGVHASSLLANTWNVPADKKEKNSFIKFDGGTATEGKEIFTKNCTSCHGDIGKNNSLKSLNPVPPDMASAQTQSLTDGEFFYILSTGRGIMPSFKNSISETDRWKVISYIRSFNSSYVQVVSKTDPTKSNLVKINIDFDSIKSVISLHITATEKNGVIALKDAEVGLFVSRHFGNLQIEKAVRTDANGFAAFAFPKDFPGDKLGNLELVVKVNDEVYGEIESKSLLKIGIPTDVPGLTTDRAMWNVMAKAPIWLLLTYGFGVLLVAACLGYVLFRLYKLKSM